MERLQLDHNTAELKKIIEEHPDLPIVILANDDSVLCEGGWTYCSSIKIEVLEMLDCEYFDYSDSVITDRDRLEEVIEDRLYDDYHDKSDEEYDKAIKEQMDMLEPYWKDVIAIYATN